MTAPPVARGKGKRSERVRGFGFLSGIVCVLGAENRHGLAVSVTTLPPPTSIISFHVSAGICYHVAFFHSAIIGVCLV